MYVWFKFYLEVFLVFCFSSYSATISNNRIKYNHLIIDFLRMLKIALCRPSIWNIFPNEPSQVIHLNIVLHFPQGLMPCFSYCLKHTAVCQGCGSGVRLDYLFHSMSTLWVLLCTTVLFGSLEWLLMCWR